jgi:ABC-2 type transport system permease protein
MNEQLELVGRLMNVSMKSWFQYRVDALLRSIAVLFRESAGIVVIYLTFLKFKEINGWNVSEMMFLFSFVFISYSFLILLFTGLRDFDYLVISGEFDRFMVRPRGLLFQVMMWDADYFAAIGHGLLGIILFAYSASKVNVQWTLVNTTLIMIGIFGAVLIQGAVFLLIASFSFLLKRTEGLKKLFFYNTRQLAQYPISIYPMPLKVFMIYIVPFSFINYFPACSILNKYQSELPFDGIILTPVIGVLLFLIAYRIWNYMLKWYSSSGN